MAAVSSQPRPRPPLVSSVALWQTNPSQADHTVFVKIVINASGNKAGAQEVRFPYKPDQESLESVIDELVDALQLRNAAHHKAIVASIRSKMASQRMCIVESSPILTDLDQNGKNKRKAPPQPHSNGQHEHEHANSKRKHKHKRKSHKHASSNGSSHSGKHRHKHSNQNQNECQNGNGAKSVPPSLNLSPKKKFDDDFIFSPLSPLVVSPRTIHRKSTATFPK